MLVCLTCWEIFDRDALNQPIGEPLYCPKKSCNGPEVVDLDECLIPAIKELNEKGYYTQFCCSGHFWNYHPESEYNGGTYIAFADLIERRDLPNLLNGFAMDDDRSGRVVIRKQYDVANPVDLHTEILKTAIDLTTWAEGLPELPEG